MKKILYMVALWGWGAFFPRGVAQNESETNQRMYHLRGRKWVTTGQIKKIEEAINLYIYLNANAQDVFCHVHHIAQNLQDSQLSLIDLENKIKCSEERLKKYVRGHFVKNGSAEEVGSQFNRVQAVTIEKAWATYTHQMKEKTDCLARIQMYSRRLNDLMQIMKHGELADVEDFMQEKIDLQDHYVQLSLALSEIKGISV